MLDYLRNLCMNYWCLGFTNVADDGGGDDAGGGGGVAGSGCGGDFVGE